MPIDADLLERIQANDSNLTWLDLSNNYFNDADIKDVAKALETNTAVKNFYLGKNKIGTGGAN